MAGKREIMYLSLYCHHQNDSCIKMGSDESHFNVPLIVRSKVSVHRPQHLERERERESRSGFEPRSLCLPASPTALLVECCFTSTETVGLLGTGAEDGHLDFHTAPEL